MPSKSIKSSPAPHKPGRKSAASKAAKIRDADRPAAGKNRRVPAAEAANPDALEGTAQPIYLRIAKHLKSAIADGRYPVGARLPTEAELCEQFSISRFTARAAVRVLSTSGLVTRRQRVGTVVIATPDDARYIYDAVTFSDLIQYAHETTLRLAYIGRIALDKARASDFNGRIGDEWTYAIGVRRQGGEGIDLGRPICVTRLFLNPVLKGIEPKLRNAEGPISRVIERDYGRPIARVEQELHAVLLTADDAANLGCQPGVPALRIVRRYYGDNGMLLEMAENVHPSDRFHYRMQLRK